MRSSLGLFTAFSLALSGCGGGQRGAAPPPIVQDDTSLGPGDVFEVRVFEEESLSGTYRVAQDGSIDYPLVGRIQVAGLEPPAVADALAEALRQGDFLRSPQVSILVEEYNSKRVSVVGAVARPGTFQFTAGMTVVQAISQAGGFTPMASTNNVVVTRRDEGQIRRYVVPVEEITEGQRDDFLLQTGDTIYVQERVF